MYGWKDQGAGDGGELVANARSKGQGAIENDFFVVFRIQNI